MADFAFSSRGTQASPGEVDAGGDELRNGDLVHEDADEAPRSARGWVISGVIDVIGFIVIALILHIWWAWTDALTWSLVSIVGWIAVDVYTDVRRRQRRRATST